MSDRICTEQDALLKENFATQNVQVDAYTVVIETGMHDNVHGSPLVYISDIDNISGGRIQSASQTSINDYKSVSDNVISSGDLVPEMVETIENPGIRENIDAIRSDFLHAADLYGFATEDASFKDMTQGWKEEFGNDIPEAGGCRVPTDAPGMN